MAQFELEIPGLFRVGAPTQAKLKELMETAFELREQYKAELAEIAKAASAKAADIVAGCPNVEKFEKLTGKRLRMTKAEAENQLSVNGLTGDAAREEVAKERLKAMGEELAETLHGMPITGASASVDASDVEELFTD